MEKELQLLSEYMIIYIQLLAGGLQDVFCKRDIPSFKYFKEHYGQMMSCSMKDSRYVNSGNKICVNYTQGLGADEGIAVRYYDSWHGCKYYPNNINGDFTIHTTELNQVLKLLSHN